MTGSVQKKKIKKGVKLYVVLNYKDRDGKSKNKWVDTGLYEKGNVKKVKSLIPKYIAKYKYLDYTKGAMQFCAFVEKWLEYKKLSIKQSTYEAYKINVNSHILPYFRKLGLDISNITPSHIADYYMSLVADDANQKRSAALKNGTIKKIASILNLIFDYAVKLETIEKNPALYIDIPKRADENRFVGKFLTHEEACDLLKAFDGHDIKAIVYVVLYYGLRRSEVLGLKWDAVDFDKNTIRIKHTIVKVSTITASDTTKTESSDRCYELLEDVKNVLLAEKQKQDEYKKLFGNTYKDSGYVFTHPDGTPLRPDCLTRTFKRVLKAHGFKEDIRFHDLRHTCASYLLINQHWDMKRIQEWLGHSRIETTANIYTHIKKENAPICTNGLEGAFKF